MSSSGRWTVMIAAAALLLPLGCDKGSGDDDGEEAPPPEPVEAVFEIEAGGVTPALTLTTQLPGNWVADDFFEGSWTPEGTNPMEAHIEVRTSCGGACEAAAIASNIESDMSQRLESVRTGAGQGPQFQANVEILEEGELPLGRFHAYRTTYPEAPPGEASGRSMTHLECYLHKPGEAYYVFIEAEAVPEHADEVYPALVDSCRNATY